MRKKIAILTILTFIIGIVAPFSVLASNGQGLYDDVYGVLIHNRGAVMGASGISTAPIPPTAPATQNLDVMIAKRGWTVDYDVDGSMALDGEGDPILIDGVLHLEATEKSTYAEPTSSRRYKTVAYTYIMENPRDPRNYFEGN